MPRKAEIKRLRAEIAEAQAALRRAEAEQRAAALRGTPIARLADGLRHRHEQNHFGRDFEIALTPRRRRA